MSDEPKRLDQLIGHAERQLGSGGMTYAEAVVFDDLISIMEHVRSRAAELVGADDRRHRGLAPQRSNGLITTP